MKINVTFLSEDVKKQSRYVEYLNSKIRDFYRRNNCYITERDIVMLEDIRDYLEGLYDPTHGYAE